MEKEIGCRVTIQEVLDIQFDYVYINYSYQMYNVSLLLVSHIIIFKKGEYIVINLLSFA